MLSVLVPIYQVADVLRDCVDSLLRQTVPLEIILVDDGSTDGSAAICDAYDEKDARVHVIHKQNGGLASARLAGIHAARGEYLAFVDSDDWVDDDLFERLLAPMSQDALVDASMGAYVTETETGMQRVIPFVPEAAILSARDAGRRMFASQGFDWSLCGKVYRASLFQDEALLQRWPKGYGEDSFINYYLVQRMRKAAYVPVQGYHYRMRKTSMMHQPQDARWMAYFRIYDELFMDAEKRDEKLAEEILSVIVGIGISIRRKFLRENCYSEEIAEMKVYFLKWQSKMEHLWTDQLRKQWETFAVVSAEAYQERKKQVEDELLRFGKAAGALYIYGTGAYGIDFARWLETLGIPWSGAIESVPRRATFFGKKVFAPDDLVGKDAAVLIAMNQKHTMEVLPALKEKGIHNILEGFKIMERV